MKYNSPTGNQIKLPQRKFIRLKGYDYSQEGLYFITICVQNRACLFGEIRWDERLGERRDERWGEPTCSPEPFSPQMILNDAGKMIAKWYFELENKFPDIRCHEMIIMPNHFHCILENVGVGADLRVCPNTNTTDIPNGNNIIPNGNIEGEHTGSPLRVCPNTTDIYVGKNIIPNGNNIVSGGNIEGEHVGSPLHRVVQWFKTMTTNEYIRGVKTLGWEPFDGKLWQRNYWEHIIRNEQSFQKISEYIINNPSNWNIDKLKS